MQKNKYNLQAGDLIFQSLKDETPFSFTIKQSGFSIQTTELNSLNTINHVGIYIGNNLIIEATPKNGVVKRLLWNFLNDANINIVTTINHYKLLKKAITRAITCLGASYNHSFYPDEDGFYCSELITYAFKTEQGNDYFQKYPMSFLDPSSNLIQPYWLAYYNSLKKEVPINVLGSHPQQLLDQTHLFKKVKQL